MSKERTRNPYFPGSDNYRAWEKGYTAALADVAGIDPEPKRNRNPKLSFPL